MAYRIETVSHRPDLAPLVARWLVKAFEHPDGRTVPEITAVLLGPPNGPEETFVLLADGRPVATASLAHDDLASCPDLTPWLAGVFVKPAFRGRGYASALVRRVEAFALAASVRTLWLYTSTAEPLYVRLGWKRISLEMDRGEQVALMSRDLIGAQP